MRNTCKLGLEKKKPQNEGGVNFHGEASLFQKLSYLIIDTFCIFLAYTLEGELFSEGRRMTGAKVS